MADQYDGRPSSQATREPLESGHPRGKGRAKRSRAKSRMAPAEFPLRLDLGAASDCDFGASCGLKGARTEREARARNCVIANLYRAHFQTSDAWVFYSRDNNHYAEYGSAKWDWYSRRNIVRVVEELESAGLLVQAKTKPGIRAKLRSKMKATAALLQHGLFNRIRDIKVHRKPPVSIRLDRRQVLSSLAQIIAEMPDEVERFEQYEIDVREQNAFLEANAVAIDLPDGCRHLESGLVEDGDVRFSIEGSSYHRVWNGDFRHGGRWYGPWWVDMPSQHRVCITINGRPTVELDFQACQPRLLLAIVGEPDPIEYHHRSVDTYKDLYSRVKHVDRDIAKLAMNILINCSKPTQCVRALMVDLANKGGEAFAELRPIAVYAIAQIKINFPEFESFWATGVGRKLQAIDGYMCALVQRVFRRRGIPVLTIHDSFIVAKEHEVLLARTMRRVFWLGCLRARRELGQEPI